MRVTTERLEHCQVNVIVELEAAEVDEKLRESARKISKKFNVPGYRRGHAPFAAVLRAFGRAAVQEQALEDFGQEWYDEALKQVEDEPYQAGELRDVEWDPFRMTVLLPLMPQVELGDYRSVRLPFEPKPVADEQMEKRLKEVQDAHAQWVPVDRPAAIGDLVVLDWAATIAGTEVAKHEGDEVILREKATLPLSGFAEAIAGMSADETRTFELTYPARYEDEKLAGKQATFVAHVHAVKEKELLPIDDDLALVVGDYDSLAGLQAAIRQQLEAEAVDAARPDYLDNLLQAMVDQAVTIDYPPQAVERESDRAMSRMEHDLEGAGIQMDKYLQMVGKTREAYKADFRPAAEVRLKKRLVLDEVAAREGLVVTEDEVEAEIENLLERLDEGDEALHQAITGAEGRLSVAEDILTTKAQHRIIAIGMGEAPPLPEPEAEPEAAEAAPVEAAEAEAAPSKAATQDEEVS
ncbi:MAG TPA: trigger factor [Anaerolineae bacterium]|nr:trigger factor [Anaerolineae bacterium]